MLLQDLRVTTHAEVVGESKHSQICQGHLPPTYESKLGGFFELLKDNVPSSPYGRNREAWFIGEEGTTGDYDFAKHKIVRHTYESWIWDLGRQLYEETGHPLAADQFLVAFIPHYTDGGSCGAHQDKEAHMRDDWIVSVSLGSTIQFEYGVSKDSLKL